MELLGKTDEHPAIARQRALKILARTIVRTLRNQGFNERHTISLATELISLVCDERRSSHVDLAA